MRLLFITVALSLSSLSLLGQTLLTVSKNISHNYPALFNSTIEITMLEKDGKSSNGTGFLIKKDGASPRVFCVTNKHIIGDYLFNKNFHLYDKITLHLYTGKDTTFNLDIPITNVLGGIVSNIRLHPDQNVDIAIIDITDILKQKNIPVNIESSSVEQLIPSDKFSEYGLSMGSFTFLLGYPLGQKMNGNRPISSPTTITDTVGKNAVDFPEQVPEYSRVQVRHNFFEVSGPVFHGMSGGPVAIIAGHYPQKIDGNGYKILGIASIFFDNGAYIYKAEKILETLKLFP